MRSLAIALAVGCSGGVSLDAPQNPNEADCEGAEPFVQGMTAESPTGRVVAIVEALPSPPDVGDNSWQLAVSRDAAPDVGLSPDLEPWMPLHGHGLTPPVYTGAETEPGTYEVPTFDLIMPGLWELRVDVAGEGEAPDVAVFSLCAEG